MGRYFFVFHSWYTVNFESANKKPPFIKVAISFWCNFSIKLSKLQRREIKLISYYKIDNIQINCKFITFVIVIIFTNFNWDTFRKERAKEKDDFDFEIVDSYPPAHWFWGFNKISCKPVCFTLVFFGDIKAVFTFISW